MISRSELLRVDGRRPLEHRPLDIGTITDTDTQGSSLTYRTGLTQLRVDLTGPMEDKDSLSNLSATQTLQDGGVDGLLLRVQFSQSAFSHRVDGSRGHRRTARDKWVHFWSPLVSFVFYRFFFLNVVAYHCWFLSFVS